MQNLEQDQSLMDIFFPTVDKQYRWSDQLLMIQSFSDELFQTRQVEKSIEATPQKIFDDNNIIDNESKLLEIDMSFSVINSTKTHSKKSPNKSKSKLGCLCKKTQCMKSYCECYSKGKGCSEFCKCLNCKNLEDRKQVQPEQELQKQKKQQKCKCKKSQCLKKYCECYSAGMSCGSHCSCNGCENLEKSTTNNQVLETDQH